MPEDRDPGRAEPSAAVSSAGEVELYETDSGVVLYDAGNPLAWIESRAPVRLDEAA